jgi:hypothetical protein
MRYTILMQKYRAIILLGLSIALLAASCTKEPLYREVPSSPRESYEDLPK